MTLLFPSYPFPFFSFFTTTFPFWTSVPAFLLAQLARLKELERGHPQRGCNSTAPNLARRPIVGIWKRYPFFQVDPSPHGAYGLTHRTWAGFQSLLTHLAGCPCAMNYMPVLAAGRSFISRLSSSATLKRRSMWVLTVHSTVTWIQHQVSVLLLVFWA